MTQDPFKLSTELIRYVRNMPVGIKTADVEARLRAILADCGFEVPEPPVYSECQDPEHTDRC